MRSILLQLVACMLLVGLLGSQSGCVTAWALEEIFSAPEEEPGWEFEDSRPPSTGWFWGRVGLAGLVLPVTLTMDALIGVSLSFLYLDLEFDLTEDDDDREEDAELDDCRSSLAGER